MGTFWKTYRQTILMLVGIVIGACVGLGFGEKATVLTPLGDIFLNLLLVVIVPLIFLTISTSISKINQPKRLGKVMGVIVLTFVITSLVAVFVGFLSTYFIRLVEPGDSEAILSSMAEDSGAVAEELSLLERTVGAITVGDFVNLLSRQNIIAIIVFSILFGMAMGMSGEKAKPLQNVLLSATDVVMSLIRIIMYYAPIGLGCYFASLIGSFGASIVFGYAKTFILYTVVAVLFYFVVYSLYAWIAAGKKGFIAFWKNILPPTFTSLGTCSSAASIPVNLEAARRIGVPEDIANTLIPLGTSFHKDGSIIGSVFKIMFLVGLFGTNVFTPMGAFQIIGVALIATLLVTAVPIGGGTISEMMILTMMGYPAAALPILTIIATIIDPPATLLNVVGDTGGAMLAARMAEGKDWMMKA
ncbi:MAG: dicarboxylate/amino acid:cation symporter [Clostridia bacterium]|nr:dicarboxylate/amino acid:cation symporter [Clostridia bacterium]